MPGSVTMLYRPVCATVSYPDLNSKCAIQIARDWNTKDEASGYEGYVLNFDLRTAFLGCYERYRVGEPTHPEHRIPAGDLDQLNRNIVARIEVIHEFCGPR